ncbi:MAG: Gfo/Idh/MocA family oxidoreductase [Candidatus Eremiobacteraeota bacterium]|nr:Gfo/Idh/MocA family oxidoreductase [Candidatus Eremiobacteraeota bacterium]
MSEGLRIAVIGAGAIGRVHAQTVASSSNARLVAVCDPDEARARDCAFSGAAAFGSVDAMLARNKVDGAIVATPPNLHRSLSEQLALAGIHVLCEKPLAIATGDARAMFRTARSAGTLLTMAAKFRFVEDVRNVRSIILSGGIGETLLLENAFTCSSPMKDRWNSDPTISGGGVIIDNGTHAIDLFRYVAGPLASVRAHEIRRFQALPVEDTAVLEACCESGAVASSDLSWSIDKRLPYYLRIHGTTGSIDLGWADSRLRRDGHWFSFGSGYSKTKSFAAVLENFIRAIRGEERPEVTEADALASVAAIEAAYRSMAEQSWLGIAA